MGGSRRCIIVPVRETLKDPVRAAFGVGMGNASTVVAGKGLRRPIRRFVKNFLITGFARIMPGTRIPGTQPVDASSIGLSCRILASSARKGRGNKAALAAAWAGVTVVMTLALFYSKVEGSSALSCLFWYFSGLIVAERMRLAFRTNRANRYWARYSRLGVDRPTPGALRHKNVPLVRQRARSREW